MNRARLFSKLALAVALTGAVSFGAASTADAKCKPNPNAICPFIYAPVTCSSNGQTYTNQCFADAACATGCVPANGV